MAEGRTNFSQLHAEYAAIKSEAGGEFHRLQAKGSAGCRAAKYGSRRAFDCSAVLGDRSTANVSHAAFAVVPRADGDAMFGDRVVSDTNRTLVPRGVISEQEIQARLQKAAEERAAQVRQEQEEVLLQIWANVVTS